MQQKSNSIKSENIVTPLLFIYHQEYITYTSIIKPTDLSLYDDNFLDHSIYHFHKPYSGTKAH